MIIHVQIGIHLLSLLFLLPALLAALHLGPPSLLFVLPIVESGFRNSRLPAYSLWGTYHPPAVTGIDAISLPVDLIFFMYTKIDFSILNCLDIRYIYRCSKAPDVL